MSGEVLFKTLCIVNIAINSFSGSVCGSSNAWGLTAVRLLPGEARDEVGVAPEIVLLDVRLWGSPGTRSGLLVL